MTHDPREALKRAAADFEFIRETLVSCLNEPERTAFWKAVSARDRCRAALTASPGEQKPCGWLYKYKTAGDWFYQETRPTDTDGMSEIEPIYLSPPPAAGWNEAIEAAINVVKPWPGAEGLAQSEAERAVENIRREFVKALEALRREAPAPERVVSVELLNIERATGDRLRSENDKLRATIASLSPSTSRPDAGGGVREQLAEALAENKALRAANTQLVLAERDRIEAALSTPPAAAESKASVEARLREDKLAAERQYLEEIADGAWGDNPLTQSAAKERLAALSAVGDKAKKSEGGVEGHASVTSTAALNETSDLSASRAESAPRDVSVPAGIKPGPSDSTAERREIVGRLRKLIGTATLLYQNAVGCAANHHSVDFEQQGLPGWLRDCERDIRAASAALDGGR